MKLTDQLRHHADQQMPTLKGAAHRAAAIRTELVATVAQIDDRWDLTPDLKARGARIARAQAAHQLRALRAEVDTAEGVLRERITAGVRAQPGGGTEAELRRQAAWSRLRDVLEADPRDRVVAASRRLHAAADSGDRDVLEAARRELPAYLEARGDLMPADLARFLDLRGGPDDARAARELEAELDRGMNRVRTTLGLVEGEVTDESFAGSPTLPAWEADRFIDVDPVLARQAHAAVAGARRVSDAAAQLGQEWASA